MVEPSEPLSQISNPYSEKGTFRSASAPKVEQYFQQVGIIYCTVAVQIAFAAAAEVEQHYFREID